MIRYCEERLPFPVVLNLNCQKKLYGVPQVANQQVLLRFFARFFQILLFLLSGQDPDTQPVDLLKRIFLNLACIAVGQPDKYGFLDDIKISHWTGSVRC